VTRLDVACICVDDGIHAALIVTGEHRDLLITRFRDDHSGPGHLPEEPPRDWYGKEAEFQRYLKRVRRALAVGAGTTEDLPTARPSEKVRDKWGRL
jgi:hypothetical protein